MNRPFQLVSGGKRREREGKERAKVKNEEDVQMEGRRKPEFTRLRPKKLSGVLHYSAEVRFFGAFSQYSSWRCYEK